MSSDSKKHSKKKKKVIGDIDDNKEMLDLDDMKQEEEILGLDATEHPTNATDEQAQLKKELMYSGEPITLNVGGLNYQTSLHTLSKHRDTVLSKMFEGKFSLKPSKDGSYFIDRDGTYFGMILNYLRTGQIIIPQTDRQYVIWHLLMESQYYRIVSLELELKIMHIASSINSSMLSLQQIAEIQTMIYPEHHKQRHTFNWKVLYKYNFVDYIHNRPFEKRIIDMRKSLLILMKTDFSNSIWAIFVGNKLEKQIEEYYAFSRNQEDKHWWQISEGFAFKLNSSEKIEVTKFHISDRGPAEWGVTVYLQPSGELYRKIEPTAIEIYQL